MSEILNAALEYLDQGFSVIPINPATKRPLIQWKKYQSELPTDEDIEEWWNKWPNANVAIITGKLSSLVAVDADSAKGIQWVNEYMDRTTVYNKTGKGCHALFKYPKKLEIGNRGRIAPDVDIRGEGGYIIAPPSIHGSGKQYEWIFIGGGWEDLQEYKPVNGETKPNPCLGNLNLNLTTIKSSPVNQPVEKGNRNNTTAQLAGKYFSLGHDYEEVLVH